MDEVVKKVAALGLPGIILAIAMATTGLTGSAAIAAALAMLGGPAGVLGGIGVLGITGLIAEYLTRESLEQLLTDVYRVRARTERTQTVLGELEWLPISEELKSRLEWEVRQVGNQQANFATSIGPVTQEAIALLEQVKGINYASDSDLKNSRPIFVLRDGTVVRIWKNWLGIDHIFLADTQGNIIYGGFVNWVDSDSLNEAIARIRTDFT
ncbi:hypothetical protein [Oscillatoria sp. HE19RPO]|uniref:hypothetical protein n=1 Tax=Oscillatoria sp. HE19RPO TaxID=2954806 RepID=UPI0020C3F1ED|nr:hypothetical protein [Oscillatoria sp. HE19RPO]